MLGFIKQFLKGPDEIDIAEDEVMLARAKAAEEQILAQEG